MQPFWNQKQLDFYEAMLKYERNIFYKKFTLFLAFINTLLTFILLTNTFIANLTTHAYIFIAIAAFFIADFVNGIVHLIMDNLDNYTSRAGPFIANFHLHHDTPLYTYNNIWQVFFYESGHKIWLALLLSLTSALMANDFLNNNFIIAFIAFFSFFSCLAEVSHFLCHNSKSKFVIILQKYRILLPKNHHLKHHQNDNTHYAFLNGSTDFLINRIAQTFFKGYKMETDKHIDLYKYRKSIHRYPELINQQK